MKIKYTVPKLLAYIYFIGLLIVSLIGAGAITALVIQHYNDEKDLGVPANIYCNNDSFDLGGYAPERKLSKEEFQMFCN